MFATRWATMNIIISNYEYQKMAENKQDLHDYPFVTLSLDNSGVSQQMAFISGQLLHPRYEDIFKMLQELADAEIQW